MPISRSVIGNPDMESCQLWHISRLVIIGIHTLFGLIGVEITVGDKTHGLARLNCSNADQRLTILAICHGSRTGKATTYLDTEQEEVQIEIQTRQNILVHHGHHN